MNKLLKNLFWDSSPQKIDLKKNSSVVIERVLEFGNPAHVRFMLRQYDREKIRQVILNSRRLTAKSANFWADIFHLPKEEIRCLSKHSLQTQKDNWPY